MATLPRPSVVHVAKEAAIPLPERVTIALAQLAETAREGQGRLPVPAVQPGRSRSRPERPILS